MIEFKDISHWQWHWFPEDTRATGCQDLWQGIWWHDIIDHDMYCNWWHGWWQKCRLLIFSKTLKNLLTRLKGKQWNAGYFCNIKLYFFWNVDCVWNPELYSDLGWVLSDLRSSVGKWPRLGMLFLSSVLECVYIYFLFWQQSLTWLGDFWNLVLRF